MTSEFDVRSRCGPMLRSVEPPPPTTSLSPVGWSYRYMMIYGFVDQTVARYDFRIHIRGSMVFVDQTGCPVREARRGSIKVLNVREARGGSIKVLNVREARGGSMR